MPNSLPTLVVNGRSYNLPKRPAVAICLDGSADEYLNAAMLRGRMPTLQKLCMNGVRGVARAAMPTFTNVNNTSIVTGVPPVQHGICGNFFFDPIAGKEVMMNSASFLRAETILAGLARSGVKVGVVTAKEKLRDIFAQGLVEKGGIAFSSEKAGATQLAIHGITDVEGMVGALAPSVYSADASIYVLKAGVSLLAARKADFLYLSTTDYIQHKAAPDEPEALNFYAAIDAELARLSELGAIIGITADHGMNAKQRSDGAPNVIYLESMLREKYGTGFRVILPITDPYVVHHAALGSFAVIHCDASVPINEVRSFLLSIPGVTEALLRREAAEKLELPFDRLGDLVICAGKDATLGLTPERHDLSALRGGLRSHGGRYEEMVPFVLSHPLAPAYRQRLLGDVRNFDLFDFLLNGIAHPA